MIQPEAAVAIVHTRAPEEAILLMRRSERLDDPWSGHWSLPGGRRDPADPDLLHTALRELEEECGIRLLPTHLERALPASLARRRVRPFVVVWPFLFRVDRELPTVLDPREAVEALWIPLQVLLDPSRHCLRPVPGVSPDLYFPVIELHHVPLWGFTYRLLSEWLGLGMQSPIEQAGAEVARLLLDFVLSHGLTLEHGWKDEAAPPVNAGNTIVKAARVSGAIPVDAVIAEFSKPGPHIAGVNCLEVRPEQLRLVGLAFEEYLIYGSP